MGRFTVVIISWCLLVTVMLGKIGCQNSVHTMTIGSEISSACKPCGHDNPCRCFGTIADCSGLNLTFIPSVGDQYNNIRFKNNGLTAIYTPGFFHNVTGIMKLDLSDNGLQYLCAGAFSLLQDLATLYIDGNQLNYTNLQPVFEITKLKTLSVISGGLGPIPENYFHKFNLPYLKLIKLSGNGMVTVNMTAFAPLRKLEELQLDGNQMTQFYSDFMPSLKRLTLNVNRLYDFPHTCRDGKPLYPSLDKLFVITNNIDTIHNASTCLPQLTFLSLKYNRFSRFKAGNFSAVSFPKLKTLYLTRMENKVSQIEAGAFSNPTLTGLYLAANELDYASASVDEQAFADCPNLKTLQLDDNVFTGISDSKFHALFLPLKSLKVLYLGNTMMKEISPHTFLAVSSVHELHLYGNRLTAVPNGAFDSLQNMTTLAIDGNLLTTVSESTFSPAIRYRLRSLNVSNNPLDCSCPLLWFRGWVMSNKGLFDYHNNYSRYNCQNLPGTDLEHWVVSQQMCLMSHASYVFTVVVVGMLVFTVTTGVLLYRYRWHIRLVLYEAFRGNPEARWRRRRPEEFQYDLFVSYSKEDVGWVIGHLIPALEQGMGLRLCVHQRDFLLGNNITDNIVYSLAVSKRVLVLFSPNFARSEWCQFELQMCLRHVVENDDVMVVAFLSHVTARELTPAMVAMLKTTTYIRWGDEPEARESFWGRMKLALNDILTERHV